MASVPFKGRFIGCASGFTAKGGNWMAPKTYSPDTPTPPRGNHRPNTSHYIRKGDLTLSDLKLAATLVDDAILGRRCTYKLDPQSIASYNRYNGRLCTYTVYTAILVLLSLAVFEKPALIDCPYWLTLVVELLCILIFVLRFLHLCNFQHHFWRNKENIFVIALLTLTLFDMVAYVIVQSLKPESAIRWTRFLRPLFLAYFSGGRQLRTFRNIRRTFVDILHVLVLFAFCVLCFSILAYKLFSKKDLTFRNGRAYFVDLTETLWDLFILVTTSNYPDVMMPAYDNNNWYALFFISYIIVNNYIFMSILLAVIYNNYRGHLKNEVKSYVFNKRRLLGEAFDILKIWNPVQDMYMVIKRDWRLLLKVLRPDFSESHVDVLLYVLDDNDDSCIEKREFVNTADLLCVRLVEKSNRKGFCCAFNDYYNIQKKLRTFVELKMFGYFFDICIIASTVCIVLDSIDIDWVFPYFFFMEIVFKLLALGFRDFFDSSWNCFDLFVVSSAFLSGLARQFFETSSVYVEALLILRLLRLSKLLMTIKRFRLLVGTVFGIGPSVLTYTGVIFSYYFVYAILGMELFGGLIHYDKEPNATELFCGTLALNGSTFFTANYCSNNFNNIAKSFVILFELMYVNQWNILTEGFVLVTSLWARLYFLSFHILCVLLVMNILVAFILEAFILEYSINGIGRVETSVEKKIKEMGLAAGDKEHICSQHKTSGIIDDDRNNISCNSDSAFGSEVCHKEAKDTSHLPKYIVEEDLKFELKLSEHKSLLVLLQSMFENELNPDDMGGENYECVDYD